MKRAFYFDDSNLLNKFSPTQLHPLFQEREVIKRDFRLKRTIKSWASDAGFVSLPYEKNLEDIKRLAQKVQKNSDTFIVIGIGGSSLGAKAAIEALRKSTKPKIVFIDNPNPATLETLLKNLVPKKTTINVISKSGSTLETLTLFFTIYDKMKTQLSPKILRERIYVTTEKGNNFLSKLARQEKWPLFYMPKDVQGRFSVLSAVGLFPMAVAGIDIESLLEGAQWVDQNSRESFLYATLAFGAHRILHKPIKVLFIYDERLSSFGDWFCQLWGESLAKSEISGPTPLKAIGAIDQHSLLQLFLHGPSNKWFTIIGINDYESKLAVPDIPILKSYGYLKNVPLARILQAEQKATEQTLTDYQNPLCKLTIPRLSPYTLGALFYHFELATASVAQFYQISPFGQPAVDAGKALTRALLKNKSF